MFDVRCSMFPRPWTLDRPSSEALAKEDGPWTHCRERFGASVPGPGLPLRLGMRLLAAGRFNRLHYVVWTTLARPPAGFVSGKSPRRIHSGAPSTATGLHHYRK